ncbi:MAG TPA: response regulator [Bryobacteraceae bacterium]|nr:response regulator [Bryobacteraceae bacterium]HXJ41830.1 response regulator [Bryobacteraceae bacterium]
MSLVVDDDCNVRMLLKALLESEGYTVLVAADGDTAMEVYEEYQSAVALLSTDVIMRSIYGPEMADRLLEREPHPRVLFMSCSEDASHGFGCVAKPFTRAGLIDRVGEVLESRERNFHFSKAN